MSKQSTERRSYSVDEMMEKLREGERAKREREEGEVVTRPDGTQVVRIRRRRRRSKQTHKTKEVRRKRFGMLAAVAGVVLLVSLAATVLILLARFNSKGYRDELKERLLASTGAQVGIEELSVTPLKVRAKAMEFQWPGSGVLKSLHLKSLAAPLEPSSLLGADWNGEVVNAGSGILRLAPPDPSVPRGILDGSFPFDYANYRCSALEIVYGEDVAAPALRVRGSEMTMRPRKDGGAQFLINGGRVAIGPWDELRITNGLAETQDEGTLQLVALRLTPPGEIPGEATLRGVEPMRPGKATILEVELASYALAHLLGGDHDGLGRLFGGLVETVDGRPGSVVFDVESPASSVMELEFTGREGTLTNFMFLGVLSQIFRNSTYNEPAAGVVSGSVKIDRDGIHLRDFDFETKALLRLQGNLDLGRDGTLAGALRIGIPQGIFLTTSLARYDNIFKVPPEGGPYGWVKVNVFGTIDHPLDDFGRIIEQAVGPSGAQPNPSGAQPSPDLDSPSPGLDNNWEETFRRLTEEPEDSSEE